MKGKIWEKPPVMNTKEVKEVNFMERHFRITLCFMSGAYHFDKIELTLFAAGLKIYVKWCWGAVADISCFSEGAQQFLHPLIYSCTFYSRVK